MKRQHFGTVQFNIGDVFNFDGIRYVVTGIARKNGVDALFVRKLRGKVLFTTVHCDGHLTKPQRSIVQ